MYWLENIIFIILFIFAEIVMVVPVYFKNIFQVAWASMGLFTTIFNVSFWIFGGLFICIYIAGRDVINFVNILRMHEGCRDF
jgi:hypothetical protein